MAQLQLCGCVIDRMLAIDALDVRVRQDDDEVEEVGDRWHATLGT